MSVEDPDEEAMREEQEREEDEAGWYEDLTRDDEEADYPD